MRKMQWIAAVMAMGLMTWTAIGAESTKSTDTPKATLERAGDAIAANDTKALADCFVPKDAKHPYAPTEEARLLLTMKRTKKVMNMAQKKYGEQANQALGNYGFILSMMSHMSEIKKVAEKGTIKITGDTALATYTSKKHGKLKSFIHVPLVKSGDRWYMTMNGPGPAKMGPFTNTLSKLLDSMNSAMKAGDNADQYAKQIKPALTDFEKTMQSQH